MSTFEKIEEIIGEIDSYQVGVQEKLDADFYALFAAPKTIDRFITFVECLLDKHQVESAKRDRMVQILADCIYIDESLQNLLYFTVAITPESNINHDTLLQSKLVNLLVSLPELISNLYGLDCPEKFTIQTYTIRLCTVIRQVLSRVHANISSFKLSHINLIVGRLCLKGYSQIVWDNLLKHLSYHITTDLKWLQIIRQILLTDSTHQAATMSMFIEPIIKMVFINSPCHRIVHNIFTFEYLKMINGNDNLLAKVEFLLTNKFLLIFHLSPTRTYHSDQFLWNILTYLCANNQQWLSTAVNNLLDTWANSSAFKFRPYYQHFYLCRLVVITAKVLFEDDTQDELSKKILSKFRSVFVCGAEIHLKSSQLEFRAIGFTATTIVMNILAKYSSINIVALELEETKSTNNEDCLYLRELAKVNVQKMFEADIIEKEAMNETKEYLKPNFTIQSERTHSTVPQHSATTDSSKLKVAQLDSDDDTEVDDLEPYDLSNDVKVEDDIRFVGKDIETTKQADVQTALLIDNSRQVPVYLQDCMDGLSQNEKPFWAEKCLQCAEKIIRANFAPSAKSSTTSPLEYGRLNTVALNFTKILFQLDNQFSLDNFNQLRMKALIALCVGAPSIVAKYISEQFYAPYLSIRHRLDVLSVLTSASEELSHMRVSDDAESKLDFPQKRHIKNEALQAVARFERKYFNITSSQDDSDDNDDDVNDANCGINWRTVVADRIRTNTRYISPAYLKRNFETTPTTTSHFVPVARHFFYPLLRDPNKVDIALKLYDEDSFVLEHLFYSLGFMLQNCANYPQVMLMAKELLQFMTSFRGHEISNVRLAMIMAFQSILRSTPTFYLFDELMNSLAEFQQWLKEIALHDVDRNCTQSASQTLGLLYKLKQSSDEERNINAVESKSLSQSEQLVQSTASLDLNSTIRIIKQTNLN